MNIFFLDQDPHKAAMMHCDSHVIKMVTECYQMMRVVCRFYDLPGVDGGLGYINHPCTRWLRRSSGNWGWVKELAHQLNNEYRYRYRKDVDHKSWENIKILPVPPLDSAPITRPALAMPDEYKSSDPVESYRRYYIFEKSRFARWTRRPEPYWWIS